MTYLLIGLAILLAVALWFRWANKIEQNSERDELIKEARARAASRDGSRAFKDTEPTDWDLALQVQTAIEVTNGVAAVKLTPAEELTVSLILEDVETLPSIQTMDGIEVQEIDMTKEVWDRVK